MKNIHRHIRAAALVVLAFLLAAIIGAHAASAQPAGKIEGGPIAKPAAAALYAPLAQGKTQDGPIGK